MTAELPGDAPRLLAAFGTGQLRRNGVPDDVTAHRRAECHRVVADALAVNPADVRHSALGVGLTEVFDAPAGPSVPAGRPEQSGWLRLDGLDPAAVRGADSLWAVINDGELLGAVRIHARRTAPDPVPAVLAGCRRRGEVRLREVLELRELRRLGHPFPAHDRVLRLAAEIESGLDGRVLAPWASGRTSPAPAPLPRPRARRRVVAISGVDGSGKSTLREGLSASLDRCGLPVGTVWVRPGMGLGWLTGPAARVKRLLRQDPVPGLRAMAAGEGGQLRSRQGAVGWVWAMAVTASFLVGVRRQHRAAYGVVIYDRHLVDALATLDFAYAGVDLRLAHALVRALLPRAATAVYLDVATEVSVARKPDDLIGADAVRRQLVGYEHWLGRLPDAPVRVDAHQPAQDVLLEVLRLLTEQA